MPKQNYGLDTQTKTTPRWAFPLGLLLLCLLLATGYATQRIAELLNYHPWLGEPVWNHYYWPWAVFSWWPHLDSEAFDPVVVTAQAIFVLPQIVVYAFLHLFWRKPKAIQGVHGTARWADKSDIKEAGLLNGEGVYVGGWENGKELVYLRHNGPEHIMAFAPTRSGKGVGLVLPTLLSWSESALILDIKGENWAATAGWRKSQGQKVLRFDPRAHNGGARYNPLAEIRLDTLSAISDAQNIASMLVDPDGKGFKDHWNKAAFSFLSGAILHCMILTKIQRGRSATLNDLSLMLADPEKEIGELFQDMLDTDHIFQLMALYPEGEAQEGTWGKVHEFIGAAAREMKNKAFQEASGVVSTAESNLALYRDPVVAWNTSTCDFRIADLMDHDDPVSLYLVIPPSDIDRLRPLIRLITNMVLRRLTEDMQFEDGRSKASYKHRLLLMLDEFPALGRLEIVERSLAFMAGYGIKAYLIVQNITQLQKEYSREESIMDNCHIRVAYAPNKMATAEELSKMTGTTTVISQKTSLSGNRSGRLGRANLSISEVRRPLLTPDECMRLPGAEKNAAGDIVKAGDMLIFPAGFRPIYGKQILHFMDPEFRKRMQIPTPRSSDTLVEGCQAQTDNQGDDYEQFISE